jgi:hypothetical protein
MIILETAIMVNERQVTRRGFFSVLLGGACAARGTVAAGTNLLVSNPVESKTMCYTLGLDINEDELRDVLSLQKQKPGQSRLSGLTDRQRAKEKRHEALVSI